MWQKLLTTVFGDFDDFDGEEEEEEEVKPLLFGSNCETEAFRALAGKSRADSTVLESLPRTGTGRSLWVKNKLEIIN